MAANHWDAPEKYQDESSQANAPFGRVDPVDLELRSATQNKNFHANPPEEQLLFAWLLSIVYVLENFFKKGLSTGLTFLFYHLHVWAQDLCQNSGW